MKRVMQFIAIAHISTAILTTHAEIPRIAEPVGTPTEGAPPKSIPPGMSDVDTGRNADAAREAADKALDPATERALRQAVARIVNASLTPGGLSDVAGALSKADRQRTGKYAGAEHEDLDRRIAEFRKNFRARYGQDFELKPDHLKGFITLRAGTEKNTAVVVLAPVADRQPRATFGTLGKPATASTHGNINASATIPDASRKDSALSPPQPVLLSFVNEGNITPIWRLNVPDTVDGPQLKEAILETLTTLEGQIKNWPDAPSEAYYQTTAHLFLSLTDLTIASEK